MFIRNFSIMVCLLALVACGKSQNAPNASDPRKQIDSPNTDLTTVGDVLKVTLVATPKPNVYFVRLDWKGASALSEHWLLQREDSKSAMKTLGTFPEATRTFQDDTITPGETYRYTLYTVKKGEQALHATTTLIVKRDLEIKAPSHHKEIIGYARLFLYPTGRIYSLKDNLLIDVEEIISDGGTIEAFPPNSAAVTGTIGVAGGNLTIKAKRGKGTLVLRASGENGGVGQPGVVGRGGTRGEKGHGGSSRKEKDGHFQICTRCPGSGGAGSPGFDGGPGFDGAPGGKSAKTFAQFLEQSPLKIHVEIAPGNGGAGGPGGAGGIGGLGGDAGDMDPQKGCLDCKFGAGANGRNGAAGANGNPGRTGRANPVCIKIGESASGDCKEFP